MPTDFKASAALVIREPAKFVARFDEFLKKNKRAWGRWRGPVRYYDPCSSVEYRTRPEVIKHFSFLYQREWRYCAFPPADEFPQDPVQVELGSLEDIAELVVLT